MLRPCLCLAVLLTSTSFLAAGEGKLAEVREEVVGPEGQESRPEECSPRKKAHCHACDCDDGLSCLPGQLFGAALLCPFLAPRTLLESEDMAEAAFPCHPYPPGHPGHLWLGRSATREIVPPEPLRWWSVRARTEYGTDFDGLDRVTGELTLDTASRLGVRTRWDFYREELSSCGCTDGIVLTTTDLTFRFAQHEMVEMYTGLGFRSYDDGTDTRFGFNFTYGAEVFFQPPWVLSTTLDAGTLGEAGVFHARAALGAVWHRLELFGGYDFLRIGSVSLQGPLLGIRLWF